jgi:uncharacterized membrane protein YebE (DUF533 family)
MKTKMLLLLTVVLSLSITGNAQSYEKAKSQQERIRHGYNSGKLTAPEARRLAYQQKYMRRDMRRAKCSGGHISRTERARIMQEQQLASRYIHHYNNNNSNRF